MHNVTKVISGGQTGVDQAALRAAMACGIAIGGWCPPGRVSEDGTISDAFPLKETPEERSPQAPEAPRSQRTEWNVRDSDGTLILRPAQHGVDDPGTRWTAECASRYRKPMLICDPENPGDVAKAQAWLSEHLILTLNVAGPSEKACPDIGASAERFVLNALAWD